MESTLDRIVVVHEQGPCNILQGLFGYDNWTMYHYEYVSEELKTDYVLPTAVFNTLFTLMNARQIYTNNGTKPMYMRDIVV